MSSNTILLAFLKLLENNFSPSLPQAMQDLPILNQSLAELKDDEIERAADIIVDWCGERQPLGKIISDSCRQISLKHPIDPIPDDRENAFRQVRTRVKEKLETLKKAQDKENG